MAKKKSKLLRSSRIKKKTSRSWLRRLIGSKLFVIIVFIVIFAGLGVAYLTRTEAAFARDDYPAADIQFIKINGWRGQNGRGPLHRSDCLSDFAQRHAHWMADAMPDGAARHSTNTVGQILSICGGTYSANAELRGVGENVHGGTSSQGDPDSTQMFHDFVNSPGHNANILGNYNKVGIGAARSTNNELWVIQIFALAYGGGYEKAYTTVEGNIDSAECNIISGWALDKYFPGRNIPVHLYFSKVGQSAQIGYSAGNTNVYRADVNYIFGMGGNHGFRFKVPLEWQGKNYVVIAYGISGPNPPISFKTKNCDSNGSLDANTRTNIAGWAFDRNNKAKNLQIIANYSWDGVNWTEKKYSGTNIVRPDVNSKYSFPSSYTKGFNFRVMDGFYGRPHWTRVYARNTDNGDTMYLNGWYTN